MPWALELKRQRQRSQRNILGKEDKIQSNTNQSVLSFKNQCFTTYAGSFIFVMQPHNTLIVYTFEYVKVMTLDCLISYQNCNQLPEAFTLFHPLDKHSQINHKKNLM